VGVIAMLAEATGELFNRSCFNFPTLGDLYKIATYNAYQNREQTRPAPSPPADGAQAAGT
jgi:NAD(P) transhydrogenase